MTDVAECDTRNMQLIYGRVSGLSVMGLIHECVIGLIHEYSQA